MNNVQDMQALRQDLQAKEKAQAARERIQTLRLELQALKRDLLNGDRVKALRHVDTMQRMLGPVQQ